jgi:DNA-binding NarL/FixJ family response regulator
LTRRSCNGCSPAAPTSPGRSPLGDLSEGELDVLRLMAEGYSNAGIGLRTHLATGTVEKRIAAVFMKLGFTEREDVNRRVRAVLLYLRESGTRH